ncbi:hypothetical protein MAR_033119 [Mya arenaria]|uniref:Uncharacterized protein n=1 Tax=Mya arenaria TaxID=6604 RepID=A0ABY7G833_MYAAR|nr:hypothetical protein MAR_033119 [Mya arenaria]
MFSLTTMKSRETMRSMKTR